MKDGTAYDERKAFTEEVSSDAIRSAPSAGRNGVCRLRFTKKPLATARFFLPQKNVTSQS